MSGKKWRGLLFGLYCAWMLWLLFGQRVPGGDVQDLQLQPFRTLRLFWHLLEHTASPGLRRHAVVNLLGNVVMFVPLGFFVPWICGVWGKFWRHLLLMTGIIVCIELSQYVLRLGTCDVDDLLLNLVGTTMGFVLWRLWQYLHDRAIAKRS